MLCTILFLPLFFEVISSLHIRENAEECANISLYRFLNQSTNCWRGKCQRDNYLRTGIVSMPGSGNSWVRHLIQMATGIHTGSVYEVNIKQRPKVFQFEGIQNSSVIGIKDHLLKNRTKKYDRIVVIVRDPLETAFSPSNFIKKDVHFLDSKVPLEHLDVVSYLEKFMKIWENWHDDLLKTYDDLCVINYGKLRKNLLEDLEPCINFLGFQMTSPLRNCILNNQEGYHKRRDKDFQEWKFILDQIPQA